MQLELRNAMEAVILLYDVWNMLKCAFELQSLSHPVSLTRWYTQERDVVWVSHLLVYEAEFLKPVHLDVP